MPDNQHSTLRQVTQHCTHPGFPLPIQLLKYLQSTPQTCKHKHLHIVKGQNARCICNRAVTAKCLMLHTHTGGHFEQCIAFCLFCQTRIIDGEVPKGLDLIKDNEVTAQLASPRCQVGKAQSQSQSNSPPLTATELSDGPLLQPTFALNMHALHRPPHFPSSALLPLQNCLCTCESCCHPSCVCAAVTSLVCCLTFLLEKHCELLCMLIMFCNHLESGAFESGAFESGAFESGALSQELQKSCSAL